MEDTMATWGSDGRLVAMLNHEIRIVPADEMPPNARSVESHLIAFAADRSRLERRIVPAEEFRPAISHTERLADPDCMANTD
jgi:hypothetical protein